MVPKIFESLKFNCRILSDEPTADKNQRGVGRLGGETDMVGVGRVEETDRLISSLGRKRNHREETDRWFPPRGSNQLLRFVSRGGEGGGAEFWTGEEMFCMHIKTLQL